MFSLVKVGNTLGHSSGITYNVLTKDSDGDLVRICSIESWGFNSCGVYNMFHFNNYGMPTIDANRFFDWLFHEAKMGTWRAHEVYFLLSSNQLESKITKALIDAKRVKKIDSFANRAHGPNRVHLFRASALMTKEERTKLKGYV